MAGASVTVVQVYTGASVGSTTTITNLRHCTTSLPNPGTSYPCIIPASGINRSFEAAIYLNAASAPSGTINNVKWYTDSAIGWTGTCSYVGTTAGYGTPAGTTATTGNDSAVATTVASTGTSASPISITGTITATTGRITDFVIRQNDHGTDGGPGTQPAETMTFRYDES